MHEATHWTRLRRSMELLSKAVAEEILRYPSPFPTSDSQYRHLLELKRMLPHELARLDVAVDLGSISVDEFVTSSPCRKTLAALMANSGSAAKH